MTTLKQSLVRQFKHPTGGLGRVAGWIMASRPSNRKRNQWAVDQLDVQPDDRVLEVGCGPGLALKRIAARLTVGCVTGIDHSRAMIAQARRRNHDAVAAGTVELRCVAVDEYLTETAGDNDELDKILAVNVAMFWPDLQATLAGLCTRLRPGGTLAIMHQPRLKPATSARAREAASRYADAMLEAGFARTEVRELTAVSPIAVCILGTH